MYLFFLGTQKSVSLAEVISVFGPDVEWISDVLVLAKKEVEDVAERSRNLGGIPRVDTVIQEFPRTEALESIYRKIATIVEANESKKYTLSFSLKTEKDTFLEIKAAAKIIGKNPEGDRQKSIATPTTAFYVTQKGGKNFSIVETKESLLLSETVFIQDPNYWTMIDFDRPHKEKEVGMLPSKLARIMINLAQPAKGSYVFDPFIGLGTIAMQADLLGHRIIGTDINAQNVDYAEENCLWMVKKGVSASRDKVFAVHDIRKPFPDIIGKRDITAIVCEPFLGPMRSKPFASQSEADKSFRQHVRPLLVALLERAAEILPRGCNLVFVKPLSKYIENGQTQWYNPQVQFSTEMWKDWTKDHKLRALEWVQKDSTIGREIVVLTKIK